VLSPAPIQGIALGPCRKDHRNETISPCTRDVEIEMAGSSRMCGEQPNPTDDRSAVQNSHVERSLTVQYVVLVQLYCVRLLYDCVPIPVGTSSYRPILLPIVRPGCGDMYENQ
jgi:hypothetical protein